MPTLSWDWPELIDQLTPIIQWNVAKMLRRWRSGHAARRDVRQEVADLTQEVFVELLKDDSRVLRHWDPERSNLDAYVGHIAYIHAARILRSPRSLWRETPVDDGEIPEKASPRNPEIEAIERDYLHSIYLCLAAKMDPEGLHLFQRLYIEHMTPKRAAEVAERTVDWVYKRQSVMRRAARACRDTEEEHSRSEGFR